LGVIGTAAVEKPAETSVIGKERKSWQKERKENRPMEKWKTR
jgi:hypothetical protein